MLGRRQELRILEREKKRRKRKEASELKRQQEKDGSIIPDPDKAAPSKPKKPILMIDSQNKIKVVIDMDFESYMSHSEIRKSVQQVGRIYSANRRCPNPFQLYVCSLKGKMKDMCTKTNTGFSNWDINCSEEDYEKWLQEIQDNQYDKNRIVYLTGDSDNTLPSIDELLKEDDNNKTKYSVFVLGGLVDHNRHKNLCQSRASQRGIATARLPIQEYMKLNQRTILSTVTVFEILIEALAMQKPWPEALRGAMPKRKIAEIYDDPKSETCDYDKEAKEFPVIQDE